MTCELLRPWWGHLTSVTPFPILKNGMKNDRPSLPARPGDLVGTGLRVATQCQVCGRAGRAVGPGYPCHQALHRLMGNPTGPQAREEWASHALMEAGAGGGAGLLCCSSAWGLGSCEQRTEGTQLRSSARSLAQLGEHGTGWEMEVINTVGRQM